MGGASESDVHPGVSDGKTADQAVRVTHHSHISTTTKAANTGRKEHEARVKPTPTESFFLEPTWGDGDAAS